MRGERPRDRTTDERDEIPPPHRLLTRTMIRVSLGNCCPAMCQIRRGQFRVINVGHPWSVVESGPDVTYSFDEGILQGTSFIFFRHGAVPYRVALPNTFGRPVVIKTSNKWGEMARWRRYMLLGT